ncbi:uncharacterized protein [Euwallacea fornicatus]|uniref:uncharacterized protein n=1 Tax=Euwallacea fornicatus TaxID=995702 RepID=UPI00338F7FCF
MKSIATSYYSSPNTLLQTLSGLNNIEYLNIQDSEEETTVNSSTNILDTLQLIQLENPNIETVFVDSDEELEQDQVNRVAVATRNSSDNIAIDLDKYEEDMHLSPKSTKTTDKQFISSIKVAACPGSQSSVDLTLNHKNVISQVNKKKFPGVLPEEAKNELNLKLLLVTSVSLAKKSDRYILAAKEATEKDLAPMNGKPMKLLEIADRKVGKVFLAIPEDVRSLLAKSGKPISLSCEKWDQSTKSVVNINSKRSDLSNETIESNSDENVSDRVKLVNKERENLSIRFKNSSESLRKRLAKSPISIFSPVDIEGKNSKKVLSVTSRTEKLCKPRNASSNIMSEYAKSSKVADNVVYSNSVPKSSVVVVAKKAVANTKVFYNCNSKENPTSGCLSFKLGPSVVTNRSKKDLLADSDLAKKILFNSQNLVVGNKVLTSITPGRKKQKIKSVSIDSSIVLANETSANTTVFDLSKEKPAFANLKSLAETASKIKLDKVQKGSVSSKKKKNCKEDKIISQKTTSPITIKAVNPSEDNLKAKKDTHKSIVNKLPPSLLSLQAKQISEKDLLNAGPKGYCLVEVNDRSKNANCLKTAVLAIPDDIAARCAANNDPLCINVPGLGSVVIPLPLISGAVCKNCPNEIKQPSISPDLSSSEMALMQETSPNFECSTPTKSFRPTFGEKPETPTSSKPGKNVCLRSATLGTAYNIKNFSSSLCTNHSLVVPNLLKDLLHESTQSYFKENNLIQSSTSLFESFPKRQKNPSSFRRPITERDLWKIHRNYPKTNPLLLEQIRETMIALHNYDETFHCWSSINGADDKEDFLGFPDGDTRSRICTAKMISQIIKLQNSLDLSLRKLHLVRLYKLEKSQPKDPLAVVDMEEWSKKRMEDIDNLSPSGLVHKTNFTNLISWMKHHNNTPPEENLLITSKVEMLEHNYADTENVERSNRKRLSEPAKYDGKKMKISTGYGLMGNIQNWRYEDCIPSKGRPRKHPVKVPKPVGRPRKDKSAKKELKKKRMKRTGISIPAEFASIVKPCYVMLNRIEGLEKFPVNTKSKAPLRKRMQYEIPQRNNSTRRRKKILNYAAIHRGIQVQPQEELHFSCDQGDELWRKHHASNVEPKEFSILHSLEDFHSSINPERPILVINEKQWAKNNLIELSENNNIVYPVTRLEDVPVSLVQFVATCNINFVKPDVLCKYLSGSSSKTPNIYVRSEHSRKLTVRETRSILKVVKKNPKSNAPEIAKQNLDNNPKQSAILTKEWLLYNAHGLLPTVPQYYFVKAETQKEIMASIMDTQALERILCSSPSIDDPDEVPPSTEKPEEPSISVVDTLKAFQLENPQIETVFIASDEEEPGFVKRHFVDSPDNEASSNLEHDYEVKHEVYQEPHTQLPNTNATFLAKPITERDLLRIRPPPISRNILKSSSLIDITDKNNPEAKKFLVIPSDVLPLFAQSKGAVSISIPGVGPVVLPKPVEFCKAMGYQVPSTLKAKLPPPYDPLSDYKFRCWRYQKNRKRDLDGFTMSDRLGFYQAEVYRTKYCVDTMNSVVKNLQLSLDKSKHELRKLVGYNCEVKELPAVRKRRGRKKMKSQKIKAKTMTLAQRKNLTNLLSWKKHFNESSEDEKSLKTEDTNTPMKQQKRSSSSDLEEEAPVTVVKKNKVGRPRKIQKATTETSVKSDIPPQTVKRGRGRPRIIRLNEEDTLPKKANEPKWGRRKAASLLPSDIQIIDSLKDFQGAIKSSKPILVVNDQQQWNSSNIAQLSVKNNVVYPLKKIEELPSSIELLAKEYNVKFVKPNVLCGYLAGEREED